MLIDSNKIKKFIQNETKSDIYILCDQYNYFNTLSMKPSCCIDIIGAKHIEFDCLFHFGLKCFTEHKLDKNYYYIMPKRKLLNQD